MHGRALSLAHQRIRARKSPTWNSESVFLSEPSENCPSAEGGITKYNWVSAQSRDVLPHRGP